MKNRMRFLVCPTYVGMNRGRAMYSMRQTVCPTYVGMNRMDIYNINGVAVCPTYVGMNREIERSIRKQKRMPHVCGDEPDEAGTAHKFYPVCPTYVGMNRCRTPRQRR